MKNYIFTVDNQNPEIKEIKDCLKKHGMSVLLCQQTGHYDTTGYWSELKLLEFDPRTRKIGSPFRVIVKGLESIAVDILMKKLFLALYRLDDLVEITEEVV